MTSDVLDVTAPGVRSNRGTMVLLSLAALAAVILSYVVTFAFVTFRAVQGVLQASHIGTSYEDLAFSAWICLAIPLLVAELVIQGRKILAVRAI